MRTISLSAAFSIFVAGYAAAQSTGAASEYWSSAIKPHFDAYVVCATRHLEARAKSDPERTFGQVEASLRPACGNNIDRARDAFTRIGVSTADANGLIRRWYTAMQGDIRAVYERSVADVIRQREVVRLQAERDRQAKDTDAERKKILDEAMSEHIECLKKEIVNIVPFSNESAETLGSVIMTKCSDHERKRVSLAIALFGIPRSSAERTLKEITDETKRVIVAEIVTFRANQVRSQGESPRNGQQPARSGQGI